MKDLGVSPLFARLTPGVIKDLKTHGRKINTYTPNGWLPLAYLIGQDISSVITNYPERALKLRKILRREKEIPKTTAGTDR